jgi:hypothetical protein
MASGYKSLAAACQQVYEPSENLVGEFVVFYSLYISLCIFACIASAPPLLQQLRGTSKAAQYLSLRIPCLPSFFVIQFCAPLFLAIHSVLLLIVRIYDVRARPVPYSSQRQFESAAVSSQIFTAFFVLAPISTLFSNLSRMIFSFRLVMLCDKIGTAVPLLALLPTASSPPLILPRPPRH